MPEVAQAQVSVLVAFRTGHTISEDRLCSALERAVPERRRELAQRILGLEFVSIMERALYGEDRPFSRRVRQGT